ncbi:MAG: phage tail assembly chaperone [Emcibacter sp.]|nr:phage tail assembly chaperone [Emcibacter sp.]
MTQINWAQYAEIAYVNFGWSPDAFWRATPTDFWCAYGGWQKLRGGGAEKPLSRSELKALVSRHGTS